MLLESQSDRGEDVDRCAGIDLVRIVGRCEVTVAVQQILCIETPFPEFAAIAHATGKSSPATPPHGVLRIRKHGAHVPCADACTESRLPALVQPCVHGMLLSKSWKLTGIVEAIDLEFFESGFREAIVDE